MATDFETLAGAWRVFRSTCLAEVDDPEIVQAIQKSFYAGAGATISIIDESDDADATFDYLVGEWDEFAEKVIGKVE